MSQPQHQSINGSKLIPTIILLLTTSCILMYQTGVGAFQLFNLAGIGRLRHTKSSYSSDGEGRRTNAFRESSRVGLRAKTAGCGLWHPAVNSPKTCTNDFEYPQSWNALSRADKKGLFYTSPHQCCMDHFHNMADDCQVVDSCEEITDELGLVDDVTVNSTSVARRMETSLSVSEPRSLQSASLDGSSSKCSLWRPSEEYPGTCTNGALSGETTFPELMYRKTHSECCRDFFKSSECSVIDSCLDYS